MQPNWLLYEDAARSVLNNIGAALGISGIGPKVKMAGASGTDWELDATAWVEGQDGFLVIEIRRYATSRLKQEDMGAFAFRVHDVGASGGIIVSPLPLQRGAAVIAKSQGFTSVTLSKDSTPETYLAEFMGQKFQGVLVAEIAHAHDCCSVSVVNHVTQIDVPRDTNQHRDNFSVRATAVSPLDSDPNKQNSGGHDRN